VRSVRKNFLGALTQEHNDRTLKKDKRTALTKKLLPPEGTLELTELSGSRKTKGKGALGCLGQGREKLWVNMTSSVAH